MGLPYDEDGPQPGAFNRFNPVRVMTRDGADAIANTSVRDFYGGVDRYFRAADDIVIMPLQSGTQWDALSHVMFEERIYNRYSADQVSSAGALRNDVRQGSDAMVGRGVLLNLPRAPTTATTSSCSAGRCRSPERSAARSTDGHQVARSR